MRPSSRSGRQGSARPGRRVRRRGKPISGAMPMPDCRGRRSRTSAPSTEIDRARFGPPGSVELRGVVQQIRQITCSSRSGVGPRPRSDALGDRRAHLVRAALMQVAGRLPRRHGRRRGARNRPAGGGGWILPLVIRETSSKRRSAGPCARSAAPPWARARSTRTRGPPGASRILRPRRCGPPGPGDCAIRGRASRGTGPSGDRPRRAPIGPAGAAPPRGSSALLSSRKTSARSPRRPPSSSRRGERTPEAQNRDPSLPQTANRLVDRPPLGDGRAASPAHGTPFSRSSGREDDRQGVIAAEESRRRYSPRIRSAPGVPAHHPGSPGLRAVITMA